MSYYEKRIAELEARVAQLSREQRMKAIPVEAKLLERYAVMQADNSRLKAEVERLRKWMDDISLDTEGRLDSGLNVGWTLLKIKQEYNAAKEGKQP